MYYEVVLDSVTIWAGNADNGIDALYEAKQENPSLDLDEAYVNTLGEKR